MEFVDSEDASLELHLKMKLKSAKLLFKGVWLQITASVDLSARNI